MYSPRVIPEQIIPQPKLAGKFLQMILGVGNDHSKPRPFNGPYRPAKWVDENFWPERGGDPEEQEIWNFKSSEDELCWDDQEATNDQDCSMDHCGAEDGWPKTTDQSISGIPNDDEEECSNCPRETTSLRNHTTFKDDHHGRSSGRMNNQTLCEQVRAIEDYGENLEELPLWWKPDLGDTLRRWFQIIQQLGSNLKMLEALDCHLNGAFAAASSVQDVTLWEACKQAERDNNPTEQYKCVGRLSQSFGEKIRVFEVDVPRPILKQEDWHEIHWQKRPEVGRWTYIEVSDSECVENPGNILETKTSRTLGSRTCLRGSRASQERERRNNHTWPRPKIKNHERRPIPNFMHNSRLQYDHQRMEEGQESRWVMMAFPTNWITELRSYVSKSNNPSQSLSGNSTDLLEVHSLPPPDEQIYSSSARFNHLEDGTHNQKCCISMRMDRCLGLGVGYFQSSFRGFRGGNFEGHNDCGHQNSVGLMKSQDLDSYTLGTALLVPAGNSRSFHAAASSTSRIWHDAHHVGRGSAGNGRDAGRIANSVPEAPIPGNDFAHDKVSRDDLAFNGGGNNRTNIYRFTDMRFEKCGRLPLADGSHHTYLPRWVRFFEAFARGEARMMVCQAVEDSTPMI